MAVAALVLWAVTASAGVALLRTGRVARRRKAGPGPAASTPARSAAIPLTEDGMPPPVPRTKVAVPPGEHPVLQFCHPRLIALHGLAAAVAITLTAVTALAASHG